MADHLDLHCPKRLHGIIRLEAIVRGGCETCRDWTATALIDDTGAVSRPEACPTCGRDVPVGRRIVIRARMDGPQ